MPHRLLRPFATLLAALALWAAPGHAQESPPAAASEADARAQAIQALIARVELPYTRQLFEMMFADLRRGAAAQFLTGIGRGAQLGDGWQPGNPQWEQARELVDRAIAIEEADGGPIFDLGRADVAAHLNVPWSAEDIAFLAATADGELGRAYASWIDLSVLPAMVTGIRKQPGYSAELSAQGVELMARARREAGPAILALERLKREHAAEVARIDALLARLDRSGGEELGRAIVVKPVSRLIAAMYGVLPALHQIVEDYRRLSADQANKL